MECERCVSVDRTLKDTYVQTAFDSEHPVNVTSITVQIMPKPKDSRISWLAQPNLFHKDLMQSSAPAELFEKTLQSPVSCLVCHRMKEQMTFPGLPGFDLVSLSVTFVASVLVFGEGSGTA